VLFEEALKGLTKLAVLGKAVAVLCSNVEREVFFSVSTPGKYDEKRRRRHGR
jgi:hypothetical protein